MLFASLGGLLFGMDQGFINGSLHFIIDEMKLSLVQGESYASIMLIGCIIGTFLSGWISRVIGRKRTLLLAALFFTVFTLMGSLTHSIFILFATRFALGLAVGSAAFFRTSLFIGNIACKYQGRNFSELFMFNSNRYISCISVKLYNWSLF